MGIANGARIQQAARDGADALPGTGRGRPFVDKLEVYKVAGKVFLIVIDDPGEPILTVKCEPDRGQVAPGGIRVDHSRPLPRQEPLDFRGSGAGRDLDVGVRTGDGLIRPRPRRSPAPPPAVVGATGTRSDLAGNRSTPRTGGAS